MIFRLYDSLVEDKWYYIQPLEFLSFLFPFFVGVMLAREKVFERMNKYKGRAYWWLLLACLIVLRCGCHDNTLIDIVYCSFFIIVYTMAPHYSLASSLLRILGKDSTGMWMIHSWICYYLFHDLLFSFQNPLMIFVSLVVVSFVLSRLIGVFVKLFPIYR